MSILKDWSTSTMGQIGKYLNGRAFKESDWRTSGRPIIRIQNLTGSGKSFNYFQGEVEPRYLVKEGDLLFSWAATLGTYIWHGPEAVLNQHIFKVESNINPRFHRYLLEHSIQEMQSKTHGSGMVHITKSEFDKIEVLIPPPDEQRRIVETLDDHLSRLDKALAEIATAKSLVEKFAPSLFHKLISDDSHESKKIPFKDFITLQRGFDLPKQDRKSGSVPIVGSNGVLGFHDEAKVRGPGVVTGRSGTIGRVHFIEGDFWALNTTLYVKDFKGNHPLFVYEYLQTLDLKHFAGGSTVPSLDRNVLNDVEVEVPTFERQIEISREMALQRESMLEVLSRVSQLDSQFDQLRRSALNVAFTGTLVKEVR